MIFALLFLGAQTATTPAKQIDMVVVDSVGRDRASVCREVYRRGGARWIDRLIEDQDRHRIYGPGRDAIFSYCNGYIDALLEEGK